MATGASQLLRRRSPSPAFSDGGDWEYYGMRGGRVLGSLTLLTVRLEDCIHLLVYLGVVFFCYRSLLHWVRWLHILTNSFKN